MRFLNWLLEPLSNIIDNKNINLTIDNKDANIIKTENIKSYKLFRPQTLDEYIGQNRTKTKVKKYIDFCKNRNIAYPHTLISGKAGMGKTTLARVIAKELNRPFKEFITSSIIIDDNFIDKLNSYRDSIIIFLDEIHTLTRPDAEKLYTIIEDFSYNNEDIKPFTLIGATTEIGEIIRHIRPFYDRFKDIIQLEDYNIDDIFKIVKQYNYKVYPTDILSDDIYILIAKNSKGIPRAAIRLLDATIYFNHDAHNALRCFGIIKDGYTIQDLKTLKYIAQNDKGVGLQGIASYLGISETNYLYEIEPYLLQTNCIVRTPRGRKITNNGLKIITILEKEVEK